MSVTIYSLFFQIYLIEVWLISNVVLTSSDYLLMLVHEHSPKTVCATGKNESPS